MNAPKLNIWDSFKHLKSDADISIYLEAAIEVAGDDSTFMAEVFDKIEQARKMNNSAQTSI